MPPSEHARWFTEEVQPHEPALRAYLQARFPTLAEHDDIVQETYSRLLRAQGNGGVRYPKAFLFTAARNVAFDLFRRRGAKPTEAVTDLVELTLLEDRPGVGELIDQSYELEVLADAVRGGVLFAPGFQFRSDPRPSNGLRLSIAMAGADEIRRGVAVLASAVRARLRGERDLALPRLRPHPQLHLHRGGAAALGL
jgi:hypothetical protein